MLAAGRTTLIIDSRSISPCSKRRASSRRSTRLAASTRAPSSDNAGACHTVLLSFVKPFPVCTSPVIPHPDGFKEYVIGAAAEIITDAALLDCDVRWHGERPGSVLRVTLKVGDPSLETWKTLAGASKEQLISTHRAHNRQIGSRLTHESPPHCPQPS